MALPLPLRNRLADLILESVHDGAAREGLAAVAAVCDDPRAVAASALPPRFPADLFERGPRGLAVRSGYAAHAREFCARARAGWGVLRARPLDPADAPLRIGAGGGGRALRRRPLLRGARAARAALVSRSGRRARATPGADPGGGGLPAPRQRQSPRRRAPAPRGRAAAPGGGLAGLELESFAAAAQRCGAAAAALDPADAGAAARFDWTMAPRFPRAAAGA